MSFELWQVAAAWRTSMATFWRRPVFISWMSFTATPTAARMFAVVSPILKRAEKTGSFPVIVTSPASGMPRPRIAITSSNPEFIVWKIDEMKGELDLQHYGRVVEPAHTE